MSTTRIHIIGVGGQGTLLATSLIGEAALIAGVPVNISEVHGMAQRGGVVESAVILGGALSTIVSDAQADILLGFEPSEALRAVAKCNPQTTVITNSHPQPPFTVAIGKGGYPNVEAALETLAGRVKRVVTLDAERLAHQAGNILSLNMVMLGALAAHASLPLGPKDLKRAISEKTKPRFLEANLKAFDLGYSAK